MDQNNIVYKLFLEEILYFQRDPFYIFKMGKGKGGKGAAGGASPAPAADVRVQ